MKKIVKRIAAMCAAVMMMSSMAIGITCPFCAQPIILAGHCFAVNSYGLIGRAIIDLSNCLYTISTAA